MIPLSGEEKQDTCLLFIFCTVDVVQILCGVAEALADLHRRHIVHADLKPSNVVVKRVRDAATQRQSWAVLVIDFGLSVPFGVDSIGGTGVYMSSEQLLNIQHLSGHSDMHRFTAVPRIVCVWLRLC